MSKKFSVGAVGGTFDRFHLGHQHLLKFASTHCDTLFIGVTESNLNTHKKYSELINPYENRVGELDQYLRQLDLTHYQIVPLNDPFGPTLTDPQIQTLVVSPQTQAGALKLNEARQQKGFSPLTIQVSSMVEDQSGEHLSSTRIRQGLVNRQGFVYASLFQQNLNLTASQKNLIRAPQGEVINFDELNPLSLARFTSIALIGDQVTQNFIAHSLPFDFAVIDNQVQRQSQITNLGSYTPVVHFRNPPGTIQKKVSDYIFNLKKKTPQIIEIEGEEDLLGFPFALSLPLNSVIFYGEPNLGLAMITLTETKKDALAHLLS